MSEASPERHAPPTERSGQRLLVAAWCWLLAAAVYVSTEAIAAAAFPGYSYAHNYISDLGIPEVGDYQGRDIDSPLHAVMNAGFIVKGLLFVAGAFFAARAFRERRPRLVLVFVALAVIHTAGIILVGVFHGSPANAENGLGALHVVGAGMAIVGGNLAAITAGVGALPLPKPVARASVALGVFGLVSLVLLRIDSADAAFQLLPDGVWERLAVYTITAWEVIVGLTLLTRSRRSDAAAPRTQIPPRARA